MTEARASAAQAAGPGNDPRTSLVQLGIAGAATIVVFAPIVYYMFLHWRAVDDYSHGLLVGPLSAFFAWERRSVLRRTPIRPSWWGVLPLALGALALLVGRMGVELMSMRVAFVLTVVGLPLLLLGREVFRVLAFPLLFLFLMVPLPQSLVNVIAFPLQLIAADFAVNSLHLLAVPALREGNIIHLVGTQLFVAEACAGLRSLMALGTLAVVFAYFFRRNPFERLLIVLSAIPIAIVVNAFRVAVTGYLAHRLGSEAADGLIHHTEGLFTFALAFGLLLIEAWLLAVFWPRRWRLPLARLRA